MAVVGGALLGIGIAVHRHFVLACAAEGNFSGSVRHHGDVCQGDFGVVLSRLPVLVGVSDGLAAVVYPIGGGLHLAVVERFLEACETVMAT